MQKNINLSFILLSVLAAMLLVSLALLYNQKEAEQKMRANTERRLEEALVAKKALEAKLREAESENASIRNSLKAGEEKFAALSRSLEEEKASVAKTASGAQEKEAQIALLKARLAESDKERERLLRDLERLNNEHLQLKFYFENMMKTKEEMDKKAKEIAEKQGVSLGTIVVQQDSR